MDVLEPVKLYARPPRASLRPHASLVGRLPSNIHLNILKYVAIPDIPAYARCSHATDALAHDETLWQTRYSYLAIDDADLTSILDKLEHRSSLDDDFGDFASGLDVMAPDEVADFVGGFDALSMIPQHKTAAAAIRSPRDTTVFKITFRSQYVRIHNILKPLTRFLASPPHIILSALSASLSSSPLHEAKLLRLLSLFLSPTIQPLRQWSSFYTSLRSAMDRFDATLLAAFDVADGKGNEPEMKEAAEASWQVWDRVGDWEMGKVWTEKREIFYQQGAWDPEDNVTYVLILSHPLFSLYLVERTTSLHLTPWIPLCALSSQPSTTMAPEPFASSRWTRWSFCSLQIALPPKWYVPRSCSYSVFIWISRSANMSQRSSHKHGKYPAQRSSLPMQQLFENAGKW